MQHSLKHVGPLMNQSISKMKSTINTILSILFPFEEPTSRTSVFIQETWLEKIMQPTQVKDYLWTSK